MNPNPRHVESNDLQVWQMIHILTVILLACALQFIVYDMTLDTSDASKMFFGLALSFSLWHPMGFLFRDKSIAEKYSHANQLFYAYGLALGFYVLHYFGN